MSSLYFGIAGYILLLFGLSFWARKGGKGENFLIASRARTQWQIAASKFAGSVGVGWLVAYTGYAYLFGFSVLGLLPGFFVSYFLFAYWAVPKIYADSVREKFYTQGDFVLSKTGSDFSKKLIDAIGVGINTLWILVGFVGGAKAMSFLGIFSYEVALLATGSVILGYLLIAGYWGVILTDLVQGGIMILMFGVILFAIFGSADSETIWSQSRGILDLGTAIGLFIYGVFASFSLPERYQLTFAAKNQNEAKKGMALALVPTVAAIFVLLGVGLYAQNLASDLDPDLVFVQLFFQYLPAEFLLVGAILFLAGLMSTADTGIWGAGSYLAFWRRGKKENKVGQIQVLMIALTALALGVGLFWRDAVDATIFAGGLTLVPSVAMMYVIWGGRNAPKFVGSIFGGFLGLGVGISIFGLKPDIALFPILFGGAGLFLGDKIAKLFLKFKK